MVDVALFLMVLYFAPLAMLAVTASLWLLIFSNQRLPLREIADFTGCPFRREYQFDMGKIACHFFTLFGGPSAPNVRAALLDSGLSFRDLGSGNGVASILYIRHFAGSNTQIFFSDRSPNLESWKIIRANDSLVEFQDAGVPETANQPSVPVKYNSVSMINSLHHLDKDEILHILSDARARGGTVFIVDPRRLHWLQPLIIPVTFFFYYIYLTATGRDQEFYRGTIWRRIANILVESWIMTADQIIGSARRYSIETILELSIAASYKIIWNKDLLMHYIALVPTELQS